MHRTFQKLVLCVTLLTFAFRILPVLPLQAQPLTGNAPLPVLLKGLAVNANDPFQLKFIIDSGQAELSAEILQDNVMKLTQYFLAAFTIPEEDVWVNLSPGEEARIVPDSLSRTLMGRDMLTQDLALKKLSAKLLSPENPIGRELWNRVYDLPGINHDVPIGSLSRVWIVPEYADVYQHGNSAYIGDFHLKVMLEAEYLKEAVDSNSRRVQALIRDIVIPEIEREVNNGEMFAPLRQIFSGMLLAVWFKSALKESLLTRSYADQNAVDGIDSVASEAAQEIYESYLSIFTKGLNQTLTEEYDPATQSLISRKYVSGGVIGAGQKHLRKSSNAQLSVLQFKGRPYEATVKLENVRPEEEAFLNQFDAAMMAGDDEYKKWDKVKSLDQIKKRGTWVFYVGGQTEHFGKVISFSDDEVRLNIHPYLKERPQIVVLNQKSLKDCYLKPKDILVKDEINSIDNFLYNQLNYARKIWKDYKSEFYHLRNLGYATVEAAMPIVNNPRFYTAIRRWLKQGYLHKSDVYALQSFSLKMLQVDRILAHPDYTEGTPFTEAIHWWQRLAWRDITVLKSMGLDLDENVIALIKSGWFYDEAKDAGIQLDGLSLLIETFEKHASHPKWAAQQAKLVESLKKKAALRKDTGPHFDLLSITKEAQARMEKIRDLEKNAMLLPDDIAPRFHKFFEIVASNLFGPVLKVGHVEPDYEMASEYSLIQWLHANVNGSAAIITGSTDNDGMAAMRGLPKYLWPRINLFTGMGSSRYSTNENNEIRPMWTADSLPLETREQIKEVFDQFFDGGLVTRLGVAKQYALKDQEETWDKFMELQAVLDDLGLNGRVEAFISDTRVGILAMNKKEALRELIRHHAENNNIEEEEDMYLIWGMVLAFGSTQLDVSYLNEVAAQGGTAVFLGGKDHPVVKRGLLHKDVIVLSIQGAKGFQAVLNTNRRWVEKLDKAMLNQPANLESKREAVGGIDLTLEDEMRVHKTGSDLLIQDLSSIGPVAGLIPVIQEIRSLNVTSIAVPAQISK